MRLTFPEGASRKDPARLGNASLEGNARRAIDIHEGEDVDGCAFKAPVCQRVSRHKDVRSVDILEKDQLDGDFVGSWIRRALPGWLP